MRWSVLILLILSFDSFSYEAYFEVYKSKHPRYIIKADSGKDYRVGDIILAIENKIELGKFKIQKINQRKGLLLIVGKSKLHKFCENCSIKRVKQGPKDLDDFMDDDDYEDDDNENTNNNGPSIKRSDMLYSGISFNFNNELLMDDVKSKGSSVEEDFDLEMKNGFGLKLEYFSYVGDFSAIKGSQNVVSVGFDIYFGREIDKGTISNSEVGKVEIDGNDLEDFSIRPISFFVNYNNILGGGPLFSAGLGFSTLGLDYTISQTVGGDSMSINYKDKSAFFFQFGIGYMSEKVLLQFTYRPVTYDLEGTYTLNGAESEMEGEITHNNLALNLMYRFN